MTNPHNYLLLCLLLLGQIPTLAQRSTPTQLQLDNLYSGEAVDVYDLRPRTLEGSLYFSEEAMPAAILLKNGKQLTHEKVLYNLESHALEILTDRDIFVLPGDAVREFVIEETKAGEVRRHRFVDPAILPGGDAIENIRFVRYEVEGEWSLLSGFEVEIFRPNYVPALDAGSRNPKAVRHERYFIAYGGHFSLVPQNKRKARRLLGEMDARAVAAFKEENVDPGKKEDLKSFVVKLNGL